LESWQDMKKNPIKYLSIPLSAAIIGYVTNWVGVKMLFYPISWTGVPLYRWPNQPLGIFGWQGIVPVKLVQMATKLVDVTISQLLKISELFNKLDAEAIATKLVSTVQPVVLSGFAPQSFLKYFPTKTAAAVIKNIDDIIDIKTLVVEGLTKDPTVLGSFFQRVAKKELGFLVESGFGFGFLLGMFQMLQWMIYPMNWTLVAGYSVVMQC
jgi:uncharacterized membrane protein YheB (UPF0754 family)